jgi:Protein of unknown function (DUF2815)
MVETVQTPSGILSYPHLFKPRPVTPGSEPRYSLNLIFDEAEQKSPEFLKLRQAANECAKEFFGDKMKNPAFVQRLRKPFRPCSDKPGVAGYDVKNGVFIAAWSKEAVRIVGPDTHEITVPGDVFPGQRARVQVRPFGYENSGNIGVSFGLQGVQITRRNMPRLDGRVNMPWDRSTEEDDDDTFVGATTGDDIPFWQPLRAA